MLNVLSMTKDKRSFSFLFFHHTLPRVDYMRDMIGGKSKNWLTSSGIAGETKNLPGVDEV
jgi:hypothetical protein